jgi:AraC-like DNA-binding protein
MNLNIHIPVTSHVSEYITGIWELQGISNAQETILPKGIVEMVFNLGDPMDGSIAGSNQFNAPLCFIQGLNTGKVEVKYYGSHHLFGMHVKQEMLKKLLGILPSELRNILIDLTLIKPVFGSLWHQLKEANDFNKRVKIIEEQFPVLPPDGCMRTQKLCTLFNNGSLNDFTSLDKLSKEVYYSTRHLNRKSKELFGISAEELITYKKFLHSVNLLHGSDSPLTALAYESGFYDQAHFCRVFKTYTGLTPKQYRNIKSENPFHLYSTAELI